MTNSVLSDVKGTPTYHNRVTFTDKAVGSKLFTMLEQPDYALNVMEDLSQNDIGIYGHSFGTFPETYASNSVINEAFDVLATSLDLNGVEILAIIEWKKYPFFAVQFHPERNMFNWEKEVYVHSLESLEASSYLSQAFATAARKNINKFSS
jgi:gamma-glutamyl hydrolase